MNHQINFTRRSSLSDGRYVKYEKEKITFGQVLGALAFGVGLLCMYIVLAPSF